MKLTAEISAVEYVDGVDVILICNLKLSHSERLIITSDSEALTIKTRYRSCHRSTVSATSF